ncbi:MAG TPA: hypothetical protein VN643_25955 [Pyrinomonadaceae bacterium]|nr:hypothetical protein [Pyrinomonadaceae bacterium]
MLSDETASSEQGINLLHAIMGYDSWHERLKLLSSPDAMDRFLNHVVTTVPYYRSLCARTLQRTSLPWKSFPIISRSDIIAGRDGFLSARFIEEAGRFTRRSSGTSGARLEVSFDLGAWYGFLYHAYVELVRYLPDSKSLFAPGKVGIVLVTNKPGRLRTTRILLPLKAALIRQLVLGRNNEEERQVVSLLRQVRIPILYGKPSNLLQLADLDERNPSSNTRISARSIMTSGENLYEDHRERLEDWFRCPVYNAYISTEGGLIGAECQYRTGLHVPQERVRLEVLKPSGRATAEGSGEILLTNLANWGMTFVRYRTGDHATIRNTSCLCGHRGPTIRDFPGRESTCFNFSGKNFSPRRFDRIIGSLPLKEFQLAQVGTSRVLVKWVPASSSLNTSAVEEMITGAIRRTLGNNVQVSTRAVVAITRPGGKMRRYVRLPGVA